MRGICAFAIFFLIVSCSSLPRTGELNYSLSSIKKIVQDIVPGKIIRRSVNGRVMTSESFNLPRNFRTQKVAMTKSGKWTELGRVTLTILGSERPYYVELGVESMLWNGTSYQPNGQLEEYTKYLIDRIQNELAKRHDNRDLINDFRAF
ncbi:MAG: hypothetical protein AB8E15_11125 [Bdellovibrionales bacterium]